MAQGRAPSSRRLGPGGWRSHPRSFGDRAGLLARGLHEGVWASAGGAAARRRRKRAVRPAGVPGGRPPGL